MRNQASIAVIIPALNEAASIGHVLRDLPAWVDDVIVADNGSTDATAEVAREHGARVVNEPERGYGAACLRAIAALDPACDVVVFLDGDYSDYPQELDGLVDPIVGGAADLVIGSRVLGQAQRGALTLPQRFGNALACWLIRFFWEVECTDLGPFRAIRRSALAALDMRDRNYGWTVEMQTRAAQRGLAMVERPVSYRRRIGKSKVSGTLRGVWGAGTKILGTIFRIAREPPPLPEPARLERLIIFTRYPEPGLTKTRLIPALGAQGAADLQAAMTARVLAWARPLQVSRRLQVEVRYEGGSAATFRMRFGGGLALAPQGRGDLGQRMQRAAAEAFAAECTGVIFVGTDVPELDAARVCAAQYALRRRDVVIGPALDGGYYLLALRRPVPEVFTEIDWGTDVVLEQTLARCVGVGIAPLRLAPLADVDRPEDLELWQRVDGGRREIAADDTAPTRSEPE